MLGRLTYIPRVEFRAAMMSIIVGFVLLGIKFTAYWLTESTAIFSDAVESIVNVMASLFALWALAIAHTPPDAEHPYGHGKVEFMSAGFEGAMILVASAFILVRTADNVFFHPQPIQKVDIGLVLVTVAMVLNGAAGWILLRVGKRQNSPTLAADGHHLLSDAVTSVAVLVGLMVVQLTPFDWADPVVAVLVALYIGWAGFRLVRQSVWGLMDTQDIEDEKALVAILNRHIEGPSPQVCSFHKLRHRHSGRYHWVDFHLVVPASLTVTEGHRIASSIEYEMEQMLGEGNATAHVEPCISTSCDRCVASHPGENASTA
jgi:cation diffusion facilitator family transporter